MHKFVFTQPSHFWVSKTFIFIQQGCIKLIKCDSKYIVIKIIFQIILITVQTKTLTSTAFFNIDHNKRCFEHQISILTPKTGTMLKNSTFPLQE